MKRKTLTVPPPSKKRKGRQPIPSAQKVLPILVIPEVGEGEINQRTLMALFQVDSVVTIWRWVRTRGFPPPVKAGGGFGGKGSNRWRISDLREYMRKQRTDVA